MSKGLISRSEDFSKWYNELVVKAGLAENSAVRGCMVVKPYGWAIWEEMKAVLDAEFKRTGHVNASFPLLIPKSFLSKEAAHIEGFAKECAVVTHYRLINNPDGEGVIVDPEAKLEEELIIRPTSETIIWNAYKNWIHSHRDLPLLINQWANVMRWEMRPRLFLRTAEFFWQEGHTAHATQQEAIDETKMILDIYADFMENTLAVPVIKGKKTASERFAGADDTYCVEALMQDGKALQMGTSHFLGQNFAKAFDVSYTNKEGKQEHVWATSWGVSTRMIGAMIMAHGDDQGLILPPKLATIQVVAVPIYRDEEQLETVRNKLNEIGSKLKEKGIRFKLDDDDTKRPGFKFAEYEMKGVPIRLALGMRDLDNNVIEVTRRDTGEKVSLPLDSEIPQKLEALLTTIQSSIFNKAKEFQSSRITEVDSFDDFKEVLEKKAGFISAHWDGTAETEAKIKEQTKATIRCIPLDAKQKEGKCVLTGNPSKQRVLFARAY